MSALQQLNPNSAMPFCSSSLVFFFVFVHLTMADPTDIGDHTPPQSPRTKDIVQDLVRKMKKHMEGFDTDVQVTNEKIGVLEATQLAINTKLGTMEASVARIDTSLTALLRHFDDLMTREHDRHQWHNNNNNNHDE
jgi:Fe-S-cluster formation regulator IscX/YfhJ